MKHPWFTIGTPEIAYGGKNYRLALNKETDPSLVSPSNPKGMTVGSGGITHLHSRAYSGGIFLVNYTNWLDGRLTTLAGARWVDANNQQFPSTAVPMVEAADENVSFSLGANYALKSWLRPYFLVSDTYNLPGVLLTVPTDPHGNPAQVSHSIGEELGVKIALGDHVSGSVSVYAVQSKKDPYAIPTELRDDANHNGINGRSAVGNVLSVDRKSQGMQASITAVPLKGWRMRFSAAYVQGEIGTDTTYDVRYNDEFNVNAAGEVTYANGTVVYVQTTGTGSNSPGVAANGPAWAPLTIAKLSDPNDIYYASPDPGSGGFTTTGGKRGRTVLANTTHANVAANGPIRTGRISLPMSAYQLAIPGYTPPTQVITSRSGDRTTGYPEYSFNFTNMYTVQSGALKGFRFGGTLLGEKGRGDLYYYSNGYNPEDTRELFKWPTQIRFNAIFGYERKFKRLTWSTQVNITNLFNHYDILIRPHPSQGFNNQADAIFVGQPREFTWINTFKF